MCDCCGKGGRHHHHDHEHGHGHGHQHSHEHGGPPHVHGQAGDGKSTGPVFTVITPKPVKKEEAKA